MSKTSIGAGDVSITILGEEMTLRPSLKAAQGISKVSGGIMEAIRAVGRFDLEAMTSVIALGTGKTTGKEIEALAIGIYENGMTDLVAPVTEFLSIVANGGRRPDGGEGTPDPQ